jgi:hypothetical protein
MCASRHRTIAKPRERDHCARDGGAARDAYLFFEEAFRAMNRELQSPQRKEGPSMAWETPAFVEIDMNAEIGAYQADDSDDYGI